ncbi:MAG: hypothetical protein ACKV22_24060 [Bryobacteraceae bacterium]
MNESADSKAWIRAVLIVLIGAPGLSAQRTITTIAGSGWVFPNSPAPATAAPLGRPEVIASDPAGNLYVADNAARVIARIADGSLRIIAGSGFRGAFLPDIGEDSRFWFAGNNGDATGATLQPITALAADADANLYFTEGSSFLRTVSRAGQISVFAGGGKVTPADGVPAREAAFRLLIGVAVAASGEIYLAESPLNPGIRIWRIGKDGKIFRLADDRAVEAGRRAVPMAVDGMGNVLVASSQPAEIHRVSPGGQIQRIVGTGTQGYAGDGGPASRAAIGEVTGLCLDQAGALYLADVLNHVVRRIGLDGVIQTVAGTGAAGPNRDGIAAVAARLNAPSGVAVDPRGTLYVADSNNSRVRAVDPSGLIRTVAGNNRYRVATDGDTGLALPLDAPRGVVLDAAGNLFISDHGANRVYRLSPSGQARLVAGNGTRGFAGDGGPAVDASLSEPDGLAVDKANNLLIADTGNFRIRRVAPDGTVTTLAGDGRELFNGDGIAASQASLGRISGLAVDALGRIYVSSISQRRVRRIDPDGTIRTAAGNGDFSLAAFGDGGPAVAARLGVPWHLAVDSAGNLYICDYSQLRKVDSRGVISTVAAFPPATTSGGFVRGVAVDAAGVPIFTEFQPGRLWHPSRVWRIAPGGRLEVIAGGGSSPSELSIYAGETGDGGLALNASLSGTAGVAVDPAGGIYIADEENQRVRKVLVEPPAFLMETQVLRFSGNSDGPPVASRRLPASATVVGVPFQVSVGGNSPWLAVTPDAAALPRTLDISVSPEGLTPGEYRGSFTVRTPSARPEERSVSVVFTVGPPLPSALRPSRERLTFTLHRGGADAQQTLAVLNAGSGSVRLRVEAPGMNYLSVQPLEATATAREPATFAVTATPASLAAGTYTSSLRITSVSSGDPLDVPVSLVVTERTQSIRLTQSGLSFTAVEEGGIVPPQRIGILNGGAGEMRWIASSSTTDGSPWLRVSPQIGASQHGVGAYAEVRVDPRGLRPGRYSGLVWVEAPGSANSPQLATVILEVLPLGSVVPAAIYPAETLFYPPYQSAQYPGAREILLYNTTGGPLSFNTANPLVTRGFAYAVEPKSGVIPRDAPARILVQPMLAGYSDRVARSVLSLQFSDGTVRDVALTAFTVALETPAGEHSTRGCAPSSLNIALRAIGQNGEGRTGWPIALEADVRDDCGSPLESGIVTASLSTGGEAAALVHSGEGRWAGTLVPGKTALPGGPVAVTVGARDAASPLQAAQSYLLPLRTADAAPSIETVVASPSADPALPLAPGSLVSIYGRSLAEAEFSPPESPFPLRLGTTEVQLGATRLPLLYASPGQINAVLPYDLEPNTLQRLIVRNRNDLSPTVDLVVAPAQPVLFTGPGRQALAAVVRDGRQFLNGPADPVSAGDLVVLYATGLGATNQPWEAGKPAPLEPLLRATAQVEVRIGGQATPVEFAGPAPGFVGLYQVNVVVSSATPRGDAVSVAITCQERTSPPAVLAIR